MLSHRAAASKDRSNCTSQKPSPSSSTLWFAQTGNSPSLLSLWLTSISTVNRTAERERKGREGTRKVDGREGERNCTEFTNQGSEEALDSIGFFDTSVTIVRQRLWRISPPCLRSKRRSRGPHHTPQAFNHSDRFGRFGLSLFWIERDRRGVVL